MKERPALPSSESFTTRQDLQGKSLSKTTKAVISEHLDAWIQGLSLRDHGVEAVVAVTAGVGVLREGHGSQRGRLPSLGVILEVYLCNQLHFYSFLCVANQPQIKMIQFLKIELF